MSFDPHPARCARRPLGRRSMALALTAAAAVPVMVGRPVRAADLSWDPGQTPTTPSGGNGTWDTTSAVWSDGASDQVWPNTTADRATFGGAPGTVTITGGNINANALTFAVGGYT